MDAGFNLTAVFQSAPFIVGSLQDSTSLTLVSKGAPYLVASQPRSAKYVNDGQGRLSKIIFTNGTQVVYNYDSLGNRLSVVTTAGPHGL